jgi:outer membrane protein
LVVSRHWNAWFDSHALDKGTIKLRKVYRLTCSADTIRTPIWLAIVAFIVLPTFCWAAVPDPNQPPSDDSPLSAGIGVVYSNGLYKGDSPKTWPIPFFSFRAGNFYLRGVAAGYELFKYDALSFDLVAQWRFEGYDHDDSDYLEGMENRRMTVDAGAKASYRDGFGTSSLTFLTDTLNRYNGQELRFSYDKRFKLTESLSLTPSVGLSYQSSHLTNYYYGVRSDEARPGRPRYVPGEAYNPFIGIGMAYKLSQEVSLTGNIRYQLLDDAITDSPIVEADYRISAMAGILYKF